MTSYIYALSNPLKSGYRYVGKTVNPEKRMASHISESAKKDTHKNRWIKSVLSFGVVPVMIILESFCDDNQDMWQSREVFWISKLKIDGHKLTNLKDGGAGGSSIALKSKSSHLRLIASFTPERRALIAASNRRRAGLPTAKRGPASEQAKANLKAAFTPERLAKMSILFKGRKRSAESIAKAVKKMTGRKHSPETCAKKSAAWTAEKKIEFSNKITGRRNTPETLAKMSAVAIAGERWRNFSTTQ